MLENIHVQFDPITTKFILLILHQSRGLGTLSMKSNEFNESHDYNFLCNKENHSTSKIS